MTRDELQARLLTTFLGELDEQVAALNGELLGLEQDPGNAETLKALFRSAHTIKGAARIVGFQQIEAACHALEEYFARLRDGSTRFEPVHTQTLLRAIDALADARVRISERKPLAGAPIEEVPARLAALTGGEADGAPPPRRSQPRERTETRAPTHGQPQPPSTAAPAPPPRADAAAADQAGDAQPAADDSAGGRADEVGAAAPELAAQAATTVRVDADKVEALHNRAGELVVAATRLDERMAELHALGEWIDEWLSARRNGGRPAPADANDSTAKHGDDTGMRIDRLRVSYTQATRALRDDVRTMRRVAGETGAAVLDLRLRPLSAAFEALPRAARDVADQSGKQVRVEIEGGDVSADRVVVDTLREPLLHLVRNAVDHGIEPPAERAAAGKSEAGTLRIGAELSEGRIVITVSDDGRGLDVAALRARLRQRGQPLPQSDRELARMLFAGGVSTRGTATEISGRGVGLDLVRDAVERIRGSVNVRWSPGKGTRFIIETPPSPTTLRALLVCCGTQILALPSLHVERLMRIRDDAIRSVDGRAVHIIEDEAVPLVPLATVLGPPLPEPRPAAHHDVVLLEVADARLGMIVDDFFAEQDIVVRPLEGAAARVPHIGGGALLSTGRVALVLHAPSLVTAGLRTASVDVRAAVADETGERARVLVVDDSITTRALEQSVLEAAGFDVVTAVDGVDGWRKLQENGADLVVADVEMPRMDGFTLCETIRRSERFRALPVVLVTALESEQHRRRGLDAGADAYLTKAAFDQETLLETIHQLLGDV